MEGTCTLYLYYEQGTSTRYLYVKYEKYEQVNKYLVRSREVFKQPLPSIQCPSKKGPRFGGGAIPYHPYAHPIAQKGGGIRMGWGMGWYGHPHPWRRADPHPSHPPIAPHQRKMGGGMMGGMMGWGIGSEVEGNGGLVAADPSHPIFDGGMDGDRVAGAWMWGGCASALLGLRSQAPMSSSKRRRGGRKLVERKPSSRRWQGGSSAQ